MEEVTEKTAPHEMVTKPDYYKDYKSISYSTIKLFSRCETLFRDQYVTKTYEEPDHDYFIYGKLVDAMVTEPAEFIDENFVRVERKVNPEDALKYENDIVDLKKEISEKNSQIEQKKEVKRNAIREKVKKIEEKITGDKVSADVRSEGLEKIAKLSKEMDEIPSDKTLEKGVEGRRTQVEELKTKLSYIQELADKIQVTNSIWLNAEDTALAIKAHPSYSNLVFNQVTSQQIFRSNKGGIPRKGKLDHLKLSPALTRYYAIYAAEQMTLEKLQEHIRNDIHKEDLWAIITDVKTCKDLKSLEPYNNHYRGQLGFYQDLVSDVLLIPIENIRCRILVADKLSNGFKKCELFEYDQTALDEIKPDVEAWVKIWFLRQQTGEYISAKAKKGMAQECFTCSECRFCPFSKNPGEPVQISGPRFGQNGKPIQVQEVLEVDELGTDEDLIE